MSGRQWVGVDLDGTLAYYDEWQGAEHVGDPVPAMLARVLGWLNQGVDVRIFTARVSDPDPLVVPAIQRWCREHIGSALPITNVKDYGMAELWDDRAVTVEANTGRALAPSRRGLA